ncbi:hypothetical protein [Pseudoalteromonas maricaloris]
MKLKLNKKAIKSLSKDLQDLPMAQTPNIAGAGNPPLYPESKFNQGCPWFTHFQVRTCPNPY